jgi:Arylsulfatase A and related enzymes
MRNVPFLSLDACRSDYLFDHGSRIASLAKNNLLFENAVAPSRWSHPSHASIFTGVPPHEHGIQTPQDEYKTIPLVEELNDAGYTTYGVSANPFCSGAYGFDTQFDTFFNTLNLENPAGIEANDIMGSLPEGDDHLNQINQYVHLLRAALGHNS